MHDRALAAIQERAREVIEGALATLFFAAVALQARLGMVGAPGPDVVALTAGTLEGPIFPAQRMNVGVTLCGVEELVDVRDHWHRCTSPLVVRLGRTRRGDSRLLRTVLRCY